MRSQALSECAVSGAISRLAALGRLGAEEVAGLAEGLREARQVRANSELTSEGGKIANAHILLTGWACRVRYFGDGRRQFLSFLLPGDLIGMCRQSNPLASTSVVTATSVTLCRAPPAPHGSALAEAYAVSGALEEYYLFRHIARLGRLNAYERMIDWMLEMHERMGAAGLAVGDSFPLPMTQEVLADALGLTSVHVNRTLQTLRREGLLELRSGQARLINRAALAELVEYRPAKVNYPA